MASSISKQLKLIVSVEGISNTIGQLNKYGEAIFFITEGFQKILAPIKSFVNFLKSTAGEYGIAEKALNSFNAILKITGIYTPEVSTRFKLFSEELRNVSIYCEDDILAATGLLQSITKLDEEGLRKIMPTVLDLAAGMGVDLNTAAEMVARSVEGSRNAFRVYGLELGGVTDKGEKLLKVQQFINETWGGRAANDVNTYLGTVKNLSLAFEDFFKSIGEISALFIGPFMSAITGGLNILTSFVEKFKEFTGLQHLTDEEKILEIKMKIAALTGEMSDETYEAQESELKGIRDLLKAGASREEMMRVMEVGAAAQADRIKETANIGKTAVQQYMDLLFELENKANKGLVAPKVSEAGVGTPLSGEMKRRLEEIGKAASLTPIQIMFTLVPLDKDELSDIQPSEIPGMASFLEKVNFDINKSISDQLINTTQAAAGAFTNLFDLIAVNANSAEKRTLNALTSIVNAVPNILQQLALVKTAGMATSGVFGLVGIGLGLITSLMSGGKESEKNAAEAAKEERAARRYAGVSRGTPTYISINPSVSITGEMVFLGDNAEVTAQKISARIVSDVKNTTDSGELNLAGLVPA